MPCSNFLRETCCRYPIYGGMQDWNYIYAGCFELTLEISDNKWPDAKEVRSSTFAILDLIHGAVVNPIDFLPFKPNIPKVIC